jgi:hypothetical protein
LIAKLQAASQALKSHLESLPGTTEIEKILINLGERHAARTSALLDTVPNSSDGLLTAVNLVQTYLQVTEFLIQNFFKDVSQLPSSEKGTLRVGTLLENLKKARQGLDDALTNILKSLKDLPSPTLPGTDNPKIDDLIQKTVDILIILSGSSSEKVTKFIQYLEQAESILGNKERDRFTLTEDQISFLIQQWGIAMEKLPSTVPANEQERKQAVTQFLKIRRFLENNYDFLTEVLRFKDPLGFRTP